MPEGPEVKVIMSNMSDMLLGNTLVAVDVINEGFQKRVKGFDKIKLPAVVNTVASKGKFGYIILDGGAAFGFAFGMTGNIRIEPTEAYLKHRKETREKYMKHCKVKFTYVLDDGTTTCFYYNSLRNFGTVNYLSAAELGKKLATLGPSILSDVALDKDALVVRWRRSTGNICKTLIERQNLISGIGNYIKAEILYRCAVDPRVDTTEVSDDDLYCLYLQAREIAQDAYEDGGASLYTYTGIHGDKSEYKTKLQVYGKCKDPHGNTVETLKTPDKRTTHWVPAVQSAVKGVKGTKGTEDDSSEPQHVPALKIKIKTKLIKPIKPVIPVVPVKQVNSKPKLILPVIRPSHPLIKVCRTKIAK